MILAQRVKVQCCNFAPYGITAHAPFFLVCTKNAVNCALATGCECKKGYLPPTCCSCDEPDFIRSLEDDEKCDGKIDS